MNSPCVYTDTDFTGIICMLKYLTKSEQNRLELILVLYYAEITTDLSENSVSVKWIISTIFLSRFFILHGRIGHLFRKMALHLSPMRSNSSNVQIGEKKSVPFSEFVPVSSPCAMKVTCTFIHPLSSDIFQGIPCVQCSCLEHYMSLAHPSGQYTTLLSSWIQRHALQFERRLKAQ